MSSAAVVVDVRHGYLVDGLRSGQEFLLEQKLNAVSGLLEYAKPIHFEEHRRSLAGALYTLLDTLQNPNRGERPKFNPYATPLLRVAVVEALIAMGNFLDGCSQEPSWVAAMELARSDSLLVVRKLVL